MSERLVDLAREIGDRRFAAGPRHRDDGGWLARMQNRRGARQCQPGIGDLREGDAGREVGRSFAGGDHGRCAARDRIRYKARAIGLRARQRHEDLAWRDFAAVESDAGNGAALAGEGIRKQAVEAQGLHHRRVASAPTGRRQA